MHPQVQRLLNQQLSVRKPIHRDGRGNVTYGDAQVIPCYLTGQVRMIRTLEGQEVVSSRTIYITGTDAELTELDKVREGVKYQVTLPDGSQPPILALQPYYNYKGELDYMEVFL